MSGAVDDHGLQDVHVGDVHDLAVAGAHHSRVHIDLFNAANVNLSLDPIVGVERCPLLKQQWSTPTGRIDGSPRKHDGLARKGTLGPGSYPAGWVT